MIPPMNLHIQLRQMLIRCLVVALSGFPLMGHASAQDPRSLLNGDPLALFRMSGAPSDHLQVVNAEGPTFAQALRARTPANPQTNPWDIRIWTLPVPNAMAAVEAGETGLVEFYARAVETTRDQAYGRFVIERAGSPFNKAVNWAFAVGKEWKRIQIPFTMDATYAAGAYNAHIWLTTEPQVIEIGALSIRVFGKGLPYAQLPMAAWPDYEGHAADAPWRAAAAQRIEELRKGNLRIQVRNDQGRALAGIPVRVRMQRHAFPFGTAVVGNALLNNATYQRVFLDNFNSAVPENDLKWMGWRDYRATALAMLDWMAARNLREVRGHNVIWPGWSFLPAELRQLETNPAALRSAVNQHIDDVVSGTRGKLYEWDVINEPVHVRDLQKILGDDEILAWMHRARQNDPDAKLYLNDYDILTHAGLNFGTQDQYFALLQHVIASNAPLDGIGMQGHFGENVTPPETVLRILDRFGSLGRAIKITEFDVDTADEALQADYLRDFLTATFSHPAVEGFLMWGFWEARHWRPQAAMFRRDWSPKPSAEVWRKLIYEHWWTNADGFTDSNGEFVVRGFLGDYQVFVDDRNGEQMKPVSLTDRQAGATEVFTAQPKQPVLPSQGIVNAASFTGGAVAPGEIITLFGEHFGAPELAHAPSSSSAGLAREVASTRVLVNGQPVPLIYSLRNQVSAIVPYGVGDTARVAMEYQGLRSNEVEVPVAAAAPGIFCYTEGRGQAVAVNYDKGRLTLNGPQSPVTAGDRLTFFLTGEGKVVPPVAEGTLPRAGAWPKPEGQVQVLFGDQEAVVEFVGLVFAGVTQVNVVVPANAPIGAAVPLRVTVGGIPAQQAVTISVAPAP